MSLVQAELPASSYQQASHLVESSLAVLLNFKWNNHPQMVVSAMEFTNSLYTCFPQQFLVKTTAVTQLAFFYCLVLNPEEFGGEIDPPLSAAAVFPTSLSSELFQELDCLQVHNKLRSLLVYYASMKNLSLVLPLLEFVEAEPASLQLYLEESLHIMLLFAAQMFASCGEEQQPLWKLMTLIATKSHYFGEELSPQVLLPALTTIVTEQVRGDVSTEPVISFLERYNSCVAPVLLEVVGSPDFIQALLPVLEIPRELKTKSSRQEVAVMASFLASLCKYVQETSATGSLVELGIIPVLEQASLQWPSVCAVYMLDALDKILRHFPPSPSALPPSLRQLMRKIPKSPAKDQFFSINHLRVLQKLLSTKQTSQQEHFRESLYNTVRALLRLTPSSLLETWLDNEFLEEFVAAVIRDSADNLCKLSVLVLSSHFIVFQIRSKEAMQVLCNLDFHDHTINVFLKQSCTKEERVQSLSCINCLLRSYQDFLKDITPFTKTELPIILVNLAKEFGVGPKSEVGDGFGQLVLGLTADKKASEDLFASGYLKQLYPLVHSSQFDPVIVRTSIHAVGNIALAGFHIKETVVEDKFHEVLIRCLECEMSSADVQVLSACVRVLHILSSGDWAKRKFTEMGLVNILVKLLTCRNETPEICWRPLGLLSSLGFMCVSNRELIITEPVLRVVQKVLMTNRNSKVISYTALVFLASTDLDRSSTTLRSLGIVDAFEHVMQDEAMLSTNSDLKRWGTSLLEKNQLFTIPLNCSSKPIGNVGRSITWPVLPKGWSDQTEDTDSAPASDDYAPPRLLPLGDQFMIPHIPKAPLVSDNAWVQLQALGLNPDVPIFRIGRVFGSTHGLCSNCDKDGKSEELVFRPESMTPQQYQCLIDRGWYRRGGVKMFRYRHNHALSCGDWETRVTLAEFDHRSHKSYKKVLRRMPEHRLEIETVRTQFNRESFDLYNSYHMAKHDKPRKSEYSYCEHIVNSPIQNQSGDGIEYGTYHQLYRLDGKLAAVGVIDVVPTGVISIYMWYDMSKEVSKLSFGVYSALKEIEYARELSKRNPAIKYYYLQGWNGNNHKLSYKANYEPEEFYSPCTVIGWVQGLENVKKAQEELRAVQRRKKQEVPDAESKDGAVGGLPNSHPLPNSSDSTSTNDVTGDALPLDRLRHKQLTGMETVDLDKLVVCLNHEEYMHLGEMMERYGMVQPQCKMISERYEELVLALGPELVSSMVIDLKACPVLKH